MADTKKQNILKKAISFTLSFIASFFLFLCTVCLTFAFVTSKIYLPTVEKISNYSAKSVPLLEEALNDLAIPSGLGNDFFTGKINKDDIKNLFTSSFLANYDGKSAPDTDCYKQNLLTMFDEFAKQNALVSDVDSASVDFLADECVAKYKNIAAPNVFKYLAIYSNKLFLPLILSSAVTLLLGLFAFFFIKKLNKGSDEFVKYRFFIFTASGIMSGLAPTFLLIGRYAQKIAISTKPMHDFFCTYINFALSILVFIALLLVLGGILPAFSKKEKKSSNF